MCGALHFNCRFRFAAVLGNKEPTEPLGALSECSMSLLAHSASCSERSFSAQRARQTFE